MEVVASAPGKVLVAGGYLVLERPNAGLVLGTTARFYAVVRPLHDEVKPESWAWAWADVKVTSPQLSREAAYKLSLKNLSLKLTSSRESANPFVEKAMQFSVAAAKASLVDKERKDALEKLLLQGLSITILGSNDFYSYRNQIEARGLPLTPEVLLSLPRFSSITFNSEVTHGTMTANKCKPEVAKTGLGSSAAMTTSVVAAVLHYLGAVNLTLSEQVSSFNTARDLDLVHTIAQSAHCIAQGKIGSGFDVSAAVFGSQRYIRFSPEILSPAQVNSGNCLVDVVADIIKQKWDHERTQFSLPPLMTLLLGEPGTGGSSTPSMVGSVKQWQKSEAQKSKETWTMLGIANSMLEKQFRSLSKLAQDHWEAYEVIIRSCSRHAYGKWMELAADQHQEMIVKSLLDARGAFIEIRFHMREMGKAAGVPVSGRILGTNPTHSSSVALLSRIGRVPGHPYKALIDPKSLPSFVEPQFQIEPVSQTRLLDDTMNMEGVLLAGVPGAGGFDAVFSVVLGEAGDAVSNAWSTNGVLPLLVREDPHGVSLEASDPRTNDVSSAVSSVQIN